MLENKRVIKTALSEGTSVVQKITGCLNTFILESVIRCFYIVLQRSFSSTTIFYHQDEDHKHDAALCGVFFTDIIFSMLINFLLKKATKNTACF